MVGSHTKWCTTDPNDPNESKYLVVSAAKNTVVYSDFFATLTSQFKIWQAEIAIYGHFEMLKWQFGLKKGSACGRFICCKLLPRWLIMSNQWTSGFLEYSPFGIIVFPLQCRINLHLT